MSDDPRGPGTASGAAAISRPPGVRGLIRSLAHRLAGARPALPVEGRLAPFGGATGWLNSPPLTPEGLRGRVVLVDFWTYTCVNWLRTLPYVRAWAAKYATAGLTVVGVHTPEFGFEHDVANVTAAARALDVGYPIALDNDYAVWGAFANHAWPAVYLADGEGRIRYHHDGEGEYAATEMAIQQLLLEAGAGDIDQDLVMVEPRGLEVAADWRTLRSPETYAGYRQTTGFAQEDFAFQFHARDLNLVMGPATRGGPAVPFRVSLDGQPAGGAYGADVRPDGRGVVADQRTYQLIRQPGPIAARRFEIEFDAAEVAVYCFTFG